MEVKLIIMNKFFIFLILILAPGYRCAAQDYPALQGKEPVSLTPGELFVLSRVPELRLPDAYKGPDAPLLPYFIDNSTQPFFRPITWQSGYECGQSAGIAFNFCYEIDRLRNLPANTPDNQYPTHFTWDFLNNANNYQGASFFDSWEIVRACGNMNVTDYGGGLNTGGYLRWISGYDKYYNGMKNRLTGIKAIQVNTPEGLQTLKYWLDDHLNGSAVGGVANMYGQYFGTPATVLPGGTPEAGKYVQTFWSSSPSHAWTVCGYNDSIRYDFNGDGKYTNDIDINGDGVVDMHDWEIGGLKFASGYAGTGWSDQGFCYTMYKNLADDIGYGGIWNHRVYIVDAKQSCSPQLTMKVTLKHTSRNKLKVTAGVNPDPNGTLPAYVLEFPIFKYQGGDQYMQGGTTDADKTIEFGLDLDPMLGQIAPGATARFFLQVEENDPAGTATGEIVNWSLMDYTSGTPVAINYPVNSTPIANNTLTRISMNAAINFNKPNITTTTLPPALLYQPYNATLTAAGGSAPYLLDVKLLYPESTAAVTFPSVTSQQLTLTNNNTGYAVKTLDFQFPFYKTTVNKVYVYADGQILFDDQPYTYPYLFDKQLLFRQTPVIAPFMADLAVYPSSSQGIWYEGNANYAIFRWKASFYGMAGTSNLNFAVKLYPSGNIEFYYGDMTFPAGTAWTGGISSGDNKNYQYSLLNNATALTTNTLDQFTGCHYPQEMTITDDGHFTGTPASPYSNLPVTFMVTDNNFVTSAKTLLFNTYGLLVNYTVNSGGDSIIEFGETTHLNLSLNDFGAQTLHNIQMWVTETDPYITLGDSTEFIAQMNGGQTLSVPDAFSFNVSPNVPDKHAFTLLLHVTSTEQNFQMPVNLKAFSPVFHVTRIQLNDGDNGWLDAGETADMLVTLQNQGGAKASMVNAHLSCADSNLILNGNTAGTNQMKPDSSRTFAFNVTGGSQAPFEHLYRMNAMITANGGVNTSDSVYLFSGKITEDFETGNFNKFPWYNTGTWPWEMETGVKKEGNYSGRSGVITDNQESVINLNAMVLQDGIISFWKYVSCEHDGSGNKNYDYFAFYIDNFELGRWDGDVPWSPESYPVTQGYHTFRWVYHKDYSVSYGLDGGFLDNILFPLMEGAIPQISVTPLSFEKTLDPGQHTEDSLVFQNTGGGIMHYMAMVFDTSIGKKDEPHDNLTGSYINCYTDGFVPGQAFNWTFVVHNLSPDNEYIKYIKMDFPPGIVVNTGTNFSGGSLGDLVFLGGSGNGATLQWQGISAGNRGVLKAGESASATITGIVNEPFNNDLFLVYDLHGDSTGANTHLLPGYVTLHNYGLANSWVSLHNNTGILMHNQTGTVGVTISAVSLSPKTYTCDLVARDIYNNKFIIPVTLHVREPIGVPPVPDRSGKLLHAGYPNPFNSTTVISFSLAVAEAVTLEFTDSRGIPVRKVNTGILPSGEHSFTWDAKDDQGHLLPSGIYLCRITARELTGIIKLIYIH